MIKLHVPHELWINARQIVMMGSSGGQAVLKMSDGTAYCCQEPFAEVLAMIEKEEAQRPGNREIGKRK